MNATVKKMMKRIEAAGLTVENPRGKSGHFRILRPNGTLVTTMASSPGDVRNELNLITRIRRATGIRV